MSITLDKEQLIASNLNLYIFQNVWNETKRALRNNVEPQMLNPRSVNGTVTIYGEPVPLPNGKDSFFIYVISRASMPGLSWPKYLEKGWMSAQELINEKNILLDVYHIHGKMFHKKDVYIRKLPLATGFLMAINKKMSSKVIPPKDMKDVRLTLYYDFDIPNDITVESYAVPVQDNLYNSRRQIWNKYQEFKTVPAGDPVPAVLMFINGIETTPVDMSSIPTGACVDLHVDRNATVDIEIDLTDPENNEAFFSTMDEVFKQIIHVPMANNPKQYIMTHNAMEIYVRKKNPEPDGTIKGLYLHRCADRSVTQITHQDVGIPVYILDAYRDYFGTDEITLRLYWRNHDAPNKLIRDKNYIDLLYHNAPDDKTILDYLSGKHKWSNVLSFWTAAHLEQSAYVNMFFDVPDVVTPDNMTYYIEALGYYHVMCLLCKHINRTIITDLYRGGYTYPKPLVYQGSPVSAVVYGDGKKIHHSNVGIKNEDTNFVTITVPDSTPIGTKLTVEMFLDGVKSLYTINPEFGSNTLTIPQTDYIILEEVPCSVPTKKYDQVVSLGYKEFTQIAGNVVKTTLPDKKYKLTFGPIMFGKRYYIVPQPRVHYWSSESHPEMDIQSKLLNGDPLYFPLKNKVFYEGINNEMVNCDYHIPVWDTESLLVYVNGRYLIRDVDYTVQTVNNYDGHLCLKALVIQNFKYLDPVDNHLEVYSTSAINENREYGYCAERKNLGLMSQAPMAGDPPIEIMGTITNNRTFIYFPETSIMHVDGYATDVLASGNILKQDPTWMRPWKTGNALEVRTSIPYFISSYMKKYHVNDDLERLELLNRYFYNMDLRAPDKIIITDPHLLYSVYTSTILRDVLMKLNLTISFDADTERMRQQLTSYEYLRDMDLVTNKLTDLTYVDGYPHYKQLHVPDIELYRLLQALIRLTMPEDVISDKLDIDITHP